MSESGNAQVIPFLVEDEAGEDVPVATTIRPSGCTWPKRCGWPRRSSSPAPSRSARRQLAARLPDGIDVAAVMRRAAGSIYAKRGVNLVRVGEAWAFRTAGDLAFLMSRDAVQQKKLSRAALEVLAIIAYHQPVTRAEIEDIRGVETSKGTLDTLMETEWVRMRGRRRTPGRPVTYGTTEGFLDHFGAGGDPRPARHRGTEGRRPARRRACRPISPCRCRRPIRTC